MNARITNPQALLTYPQKRYAFGVGIGEAKPFRQWTMTQGEFQTKLDALNGKAQVKVKTDNRTLVKAEPQLAFANVLKNEIRGLELRLSKRIKAEVREQFEAFTK